MTKLFFLNELSSHFLLFKDIEASCVVYRYLTKNIIINSLYIITIKVPMSSYFSNTLMADKVVLGSGEVTGNRFKLLLHTIHAELATLLQTEGTNIITYKVTTG